MSLHPGQPKHEIQQLMFAPLQLSYLYIYGAYLELVEKYVIQNNKF